MRPAARPKRLLAPDRLSGETVLDWPRRPRCRSPRRWQYRRPPGWTFARSRGARHATARRKRTGSPCGQPSPKPAPCGRFAPRLRRAAPVRAATRSSIAFDIDSARHRREQSLPTTTYSQRRIFRKGISPLREQSPETCEPPHSASGAFVREPGRNRWDQTKRQARLAAKGRSTRAPPGAPNLPATGCRQKPRSTSRENFRSLAGPAATLATALGARMQENRETHTQRVRNHQCHRATAASWGGAEFRSGEEMACMTYWAESAGSKTYSPSSPSAGCLVKVFISCSLILIFPDFSICWRRFAMNRPNNSDCLFCTRASRI